MTNYTKVRQSREQVTTAADGLKYKIYAWVEEKGDLPQQEIFVFKIVDRVAPSSDTFEKVADPYELTSYPIQRASALSSGSTYYLGSEVIKYYDDIDTANTAVTVLKSRIDELVNGWNTYQTSFCTTLVAPTYEETLHPETEETYEDLLKAAYVTAKTARRAAEATKSTKTTAYTTAVTAASTAAELVVAYETALDYCTKIKTYWSDNVDGFSPASNAFVSGAITFLSKTNTFIVASNTYYDYNVPSSSTITLANTDSDYFEVIGDISRCLSENDTFTVTGSTANDGTYTVSNNYPAFMYSALTNKTRVYVKENIPNATADGYINISIGRTEDETFNDALDTFESNEDTFTQNLEDRNAASGVAGNLDNTITTFYTWLGGKVTTARNDSDTKDTAVATAKTELEAAEAALTAALAAEETALAAIIDVCPDYAYQDV